jgi:hypothetical protein
LASATAASRRELVAGGAVSGVVGHVGPALLEGGECGGDPCVAGLAQRVLHADQRRRPSFEGGPVAVLEAGAGVEEGVDHPLDGTDGDPVADVLRT